MSFIQVSQFVLAGSTISSLATDPKSIVPSWFQAGRYRDHSLLYLPLLCELAGPRVRQRRTVSLFHHSSTRPHWQGRELAVACLIVIVLQVDVLVSMADCDDLQVRHHRDSFTFLRFIQLRVKKDFETGKRPLMQLHPRGRREVSFGSRSFQPRSFKRQPACLYPGLTSVFSLLSMSRPYSVVPRKTFGLYHCLALSSDVGGVKRDSR